MIKSDSSGYQIDILDRLEHQGYIVNETLIKDCLRSLVQILMDIEVSQVLDASRYERSETRRAYRNGYRATVWNSPIGDLELGIPKLRRGTYYPERLLNDVDVVDTLVRLIKMTIIYGIDEMIVSESLSRLDLFPLSSYELHRICDALYGVLGQVQEISDITESEMLSEEELTLHHRKNLLHLHRHKANHHEITHVDKEFWRDFTRRMSQAGLIVESQQTVLSDVNPYARLAVDKIKSIVQPNFTRHIHTFYEEQLIA